MSSTTRLIVWFSSGVPSAVTAKLALLHYRDAFDVLIVSCDTRPSEHADNYRFSAECERWFGQPITYIRNDDFQTVDDVFVKTKYMAGVRGARCTTELKKIPRLRFAKDDDAHAFGFTLEEGKRVREFENRNPDLRLKWILVECGMTRARCESELAKAGIELPAMYRLFDDADRARFGVSGFDNNNCPGCVKATAPWYWDMVRKYFPDVFKRRCEQSRELGVRLVEIKHHQRIFLDELPPGPFRKGRKKQRMSCGPECGTQLLLNAA